MPNSCGRSKTVPKAASDKTEVISSAFSAGTPSLVCRARVGSLGGLTGSEGLNTQPAPHFRRCLPARRYSRSPKFRSA